MTKGLLIDQSTMVVRLMMKSIIFIPVFTVSFVLLAELNALMIPTMFSPTYFLSVLMTWLLAGGIATSLTRSIKI